MKFYVGFIFGEGARCAGRAHSYEIFSGCTQRRDRWRSLVAIELRTELLVLAVLNFPPNTPGYTAYEQENSNPHPPRHNAPPKDLTLSYNYQKKCQQKNPPKRRVYFVLLFPRGGGPQARGVCRSLHKLRQLPPPALMACRAGLPPLSKRGIYFISSYSPLSQSLL